MDYFKSRSSRASILADDPSYYTLLRIKLYNPKCQYKGISISCKLLVYVKIEKDLKDTIKRDDTKDVQNRGGPLSLHFYDQQRQKSGMTHDRGQLWCK